MGPDRKNVVQGKGGSFHCDPGAEAAMLDKQGKVAANNILRERLFQMTSF